MHIELEDNFNIDTWSGFLGFFKLQNLQSSHCFYILFRGHECILNIQPSYQK